MEKRDPFDEDSLQLKRILNFRTYGELEEYGIEFLTGEACALGNRKLFDLSEEGVRHVEDFLGGALSFREGSNTNPGAVASVLLASSMIPDLALHIMWSECPDADWVVKTPTAIFRATDEIKALVNERANAQYHDNHEEWREQLPRHEESVVYALERIEDYRFYRGKSNTRHPHRGSKNVHSFTGTTTP